jgi:hypothetical protein
MSLFNRYQNDQNYYIIEKLVNDLKKKILAFEIGSFKSKEKIKSLNLEIELKTLELKNYRENIKGFNLWFFVFGFCLYHTCFIFYKKKLLYELPRSDYIKHLTLCTLSGISLGSLIGYRFSYNLSLYRYLKKNEHKLQNISKDFEYYYILNKEQEFDD